VFDLRSPRAVQDAPIDNIKSLPEPTWHRRLRSQRSAARWLLSRSTAGVENIGVDRLRRAAGRLQGHRGSRLTKRASATLQMGRGEWHCRECNYTNFWHRNKCLRCQKKFETGGGYANQERHGRRSSRSQSRQQEYHEGGRASDRQASRSDRYERSSRPTQSDEQQPNWLPQLHDADTKRQDDTLLDRYRTKKGALGMLIKVSGEEAFSVVAVRAELKVIETARLMLRSQPDREKFMEEKLDALEIERTGKQEQVEKLQQDIQSLDDDIEEHSMTLAGLRSDAAMEAAAVAAATEAATLRTRLLAQQTLRQPQPQQQAPGLPMTIDLEVEDQRQEAAIRAETVAQQIERLKARATEDGNEALSQMIEALSQIALTTEPTVQSGVPSASSSRRARQPFGAATGAVEQAPERGGAPMSGVSGQEDRSVRARTLSPRSAEQRAEVQRLAQEQATATQAAVFQVAGATSVG
jgi:hypothetical protein